MILVESILISSLLGNASRMLFILRTYPNIFEILKVGLSITENVYEF